MSEEHLMFWDSSLTSLMVNSFGYWCCQLSDDVREDTVGD